ncbi:hypothetical protein K1719_034351 [Acacia pycnantha]|nr:hypothetical protein K1719_034351 [Acacia pycnantha]
MQRLTIPDIKSVVCTPNHPGSLSLVKSKGFADSIAENSTCFIDYESEGSDVPELATPEKTSPLTRSLAIISGKPLMNQLIILFLSLSTFHLSISGVTSTTFTIVNNCNYTIWPAIVSHGGVSDISPTGFVLAKGESRTISVPTSWSGSLWGRTNCATDSSGTFSCRTGDCGSGKLDCEDKGSEVLATRVEFSLGQAADLDSYYVNLVNGYNVPMTVSPQGIKNCHSTGCTEDLNTICPHEHRAVFSENGKTAGCQNACKLNPTLYCSKPNHYSQIFDSACPYAHFLPNNGKETPFTCPAAPIYSISFCNPSPNPDKRHLIFIIVITIIIGAIIVNGTCAFFFRKWIAKHSARIWKTICFFLLKKHGSYVEKTSDSNIIGEFSQVKFPQELFVYDFNKVAIATNNFHLSNKLGQGGFGLVYKGTLPHGQHVAIKRLSRASGQGQEEFMNEMVVISKLQHRNLVRLLGCCVEGEEKMLIYEYMPNKSLDAFIFDPSNRKPLDWGKRFGIIEGIARGILYLHRDSRLKIIHRDLKASNILLDENLFPKISDFGMGRIFKESEDHANTKRVVGTYGYIGRKNSSFYHNEHSLSLLGFAWKYWNEKNLTLLIDNEISNPSLEKDILSITVACYRMKKSGTDMVLKTLVFSVASPSSSVQLATSSGSDALPFCVYSLRWRWVKSPATMVVKAIVVGDNG